MGLPTAVGHDVGINIRVLESERQGAVRVGV